MFGLLLVVWLVATGEGLIAAGDGIFSRWQHRAFAMLCHQDPARSFWFNGSPMAVCTRCYGIYASLPLAWLLIPFAGRLIERINVWAGTMLLAAVGLNILDLLGNLLGFWENTPASRTLLGVAVGISVAAFLGAEFFLSHQQNKEE